MGKFERGTGIVTSNYNMVLQYVIRFLSIIDTVKNAVMVLVLALNEESDGYGYLCHTNSKPMEFSFVASAQHCVHLDNPTDSFCSELRPANLKTMIALAASASGLSNNRVEAMDDTDEVRIGIEFASSPYPGVDDDGPCVTISDHGNNARLLMGAAVPYEFWPSLDSIDVKTEINGSYVGQWRPRSHKRGLPFRRGRWS